MTRFTILATLRTLAENTISPRNHREGFRIDFSRNYHEQEKRLASLDLMKFNEAKFQHEKSCKSLLQYKEQLAKCKSKHSFLVQSIAELKRSLEKEESETRQIQATLNKKETMKNIMISEKIRNDQKVKELNAAMRRIRLDPRRHDLPEVSEYALIKRENENLKKNIKKWQKKVAIAERELLRVIDYPHSNRKLCRNALYRERGLESQIAIRYSDEAHFWLNGYVNKQNCRIWSEANPQVYVETPLHPEKLTVWCALWAGGILLQKR
ncbi:uncharacterized protein TNCV_4835711 [Trichonephila clavipes]|nr:uncharacterized protein TNCV_4835711 [Trichonephila clavipes]